MRVLYLFIRSRQTERAVGALLVVGVVAWLWGRLFGFDEDMLTVGLVMFPLLAAAALGAVTMSPFGELERAASRPLRGKYLMQSGMLLVIAMAGFLAATWNWQVDGAAERALRNLLGFAGLSLLAATLCGGRLAWSIPFAYGLGSVALVEDSRHQGWALPFRPGGDELALAAAVTVLATGLTLIARCGPRDSSHH